MPSTSPHPHDLNTQPRSRWRRRIAWGTVLAVALIGATALLGPRNDWGPAVAASRDLPPDSATQVEAWVQAQEAQWRDIKPNNAKGIVWAQAPGQRTEWAVVYVHGFSASRLETAPLTERVSTALGANSYYARLTGHGRQSPQAMAEASPQDWMADVLEAAKIGQTLGEKVLMISCSTGGTLATWLGTTNMGKLVDAHAMISPNFGPKDARAEIINQPWGTVIAKWIQGPTRSWTPKTEAEANAWTSSYPTEALFPMMALVQQVRESDLSSFKTPALILLSEQDKTVEPAQTKAAFARLGSAQKQLNVVNDSTAVGQHVLAGAITAPESVAPMAEAIVRWVKTLPMH